MADEVNRAYRVVVTRNDIVDHVRVTVGVGQSHHRYLESVRLFDQELLTLRVDHEDRPRQPLHLGDTSKVAPELLVLTIESKPLPARPLLLRRLLHGLREVLKACSATVSWACFFVPTNSISRPASATARTNFRARSRRVTVWSRSMMWTPPRSANIYRFILGFHRRAW